MKKAEVTLNLVSLKVVLAMVVMALIATDGLCLTYYQEVTADNPVGYYRLGEAAGSGSVASDSSASAAENGSVNGGITLGVAGALADGDTAAHFDGVNSYIEILDTNHVLDLETGNPFSMEYFMKPDAHRSGQSNYHVVSRSDGTGAADAFIVNSGSGANPAENVRFHTDGWAGHNHRADSAANTVVLNEWTHVVGTYNGSNEMALYLNGQQVALVTDINRGPGADADAGNVYFGQLGNSPGSVDYPGGLDEVAFYDTVLSADRVLAHYNAASVVPEPTSLALLAMCLGGLLAWYRKR